MPRAHAGIMGLLAALVVSAALAATTAEAASKWYWSERKAEVRLQQRYSDIASVSCIGFGYDWKVHGGVEFFRAFYCSGELANGSGYEVVVYPRGNTAFRVDPY